MALELNRLIRNLAQLKNEHTNQNKFLKTKPKIKAYKENFKESEKEATAYHDYVKRAEIEMGAGGAVPPLEGDSFKFLPDRIIDLISPISTAARIEDTEKLRTELEIGLLTTTNGMRYLTTRARAIQLGGSFKKMSTSIARNLSTMKGELK